MVWLRLVPELRYNVQKERRAITQKIEWGKPIIIWGIPVIGSRSSVSRWKDASQNKRSNLWNCIEKLQLCKRAFKEVTFPFTLHSAHLHLQQDAGMQEHFHQTKTWVTHL